MAKGTFSLSNLQVAGRVGDLVFLPQGDGRLVVRRMPTDLPARTPLQREGEARMRVVGAAWQALTIEEGEAWARYVEAARGWPLPPGGKAPTQGYGAFLGLGAKILQMRPEGPVPAAPPTTPFLGDGIAVAVADLSGPIAGDLGPLTPAPLPRRGEGSGSSGVVFSASGPNAPGVVTELLVQRLQGVHRKPTAKGYRTAGFVAFAAGALAAAVPCEPGAYACAIRFVREATGQETGLVPIGKIVVG